MGLGEKRGKRVLKERYRYFFYIINIFSRKLLFLLKYRSVIGGGGHRPWAMPIRLATPLSEMYTESFFLHCWNTLNG